MTLGASILFCAGCAVLVLHFFRRLTGDEQADTRRWFWNWFSKGLVLPVVTWMLWSSGILPSLPSLMPQIARVQWAGGNWFSPFVEVLASSMIIISSYWAAMSFVWFCGFIALREDIRSDFLAQRNKAAEPNKTHR